MTRNPKMWGLGPYQDSTLYVPGKGCLTACQTRCICWRKYSIFYHRKYGPASAVYDRRVVYLEEKDGSKERELMRLESWRGNWRRRALELIGVSKGEYVKLIVEAKINGNDV